MDMKFVVGIGIGMAAGAAAGIAMHPKKKHHSAAGRAIRAAESVLEAMSH